MEAKTLALYLGCEVYIFPKETIENGWLKARLTKLPDLQYKHELTISNFNIVLDAGYLPILRPLSSMTEEHKEQLFDYLWPAGLWSIVWAGKINVIEGLLDIPESEYDIAVRVREVMSHGLWAKLLNKARELNYDCDNLIETNQAIDQTLTKEK